MATRIAPAFVSRSTRNPVVSRCFSCGNPLLGRRRRNPDSTPPDPPLLHELFPEQAAKATVPPSPPRERRQPRERRVPRLNFDHGDAGAAATSAAVAHARTREPGPHQLVESRNRSGVLKLVAASSSLCETDFRRLSPRGKHLEEWRGRGQLKKVIVKRDFRTLERQDAYYLLFDTPDDALAYLRHVEQVFKLARMYTPQHLLSPMPPAPSINGDGVDVHAHIQKFALQPLDQHLDLQHKQVSSERRYKYVFERGGYWPLRRGNSAKVLLWFDGDQPTYTELWRAIGRDGDIRGLRWSLAGDLPLIRVDSSWFDLEKGQDRPGGPVDPDGPWYVSCDFEKEKESTIAKESSENVHNREPWMVSFTNPEEAQRFARSWHRRRLPETRNMEKRDYERPLVTAEAVW